jgi:hypothetical protein
VKELPLIANSYQIPIINEVIKRSAAVRSYNDDLKYGSLQNFSAWNNFPFSDVIVFGAAGWQ